MNKTYYMYACGTYAVNAYVKQVFMICYLWSVLGKISSIYKNTENDIWDPIYPLTNLVIISSSQCYWVPSHTVSTSWLILNQTLDIITHNYVSISKEKKS